MAIIVFLIILSVLVIVHELGHFLVAKYFQVRVDEFGLGYPPKAKKLFTWRGTDFTLNWLPFGGFVKIFGENPAEVVAENNSERFTAKNRGIQAAVLVAGVVANFLFAWLLMSVGFVYGMPSSSALNLPLQNPQTTITLVSPASPAESAGLKSGDVITYPKLSPEELTKFIGSAKGSVELGVKRGAETLTARVTPVEGLVEGRKAIGIAMDTIGLAKLSPLEALWQGLKTTGELTWLTAIALGKFIGQAIVGHADLSQVTGPVGLIGLVGDVANLGFAYLLSFVALISINLSIVNLLPFPALDGGRLLFVLIEAIRRKNIPAKIFNAVNLIGFSILVILMVIITLRDIANLI